MSELGMLRQEYLLGGDWNERASNHGRYAPWGIAHQLGIGIYTPGPKSIDWVMSSATVTGMQRVGFGGSDHQMVVFTVHYPGQPKLDLHGAIWNCERDRDPSEVASWLAARMKEHGLHFALLQEAKQYHDALENLPGVNVIAYGRPMGAQHSVIVVRDGVDVNSAESEQMSKTGWLLRGWGGDNMHAAHFTTFATLNGWLTVGSCHEVVAVDWRDKGGVWRAVGALDRIRARRQAARRYIARGRRVLGRNHKRETR